MLILAVANFMVLVKEAVLNVKVVKVMDCNDESKTLMGKTK